MAVSRDDPYSSFSFRVQVSWEDDGTEPSASFSDSPALDAGGSSVGLETLEICHEGLEIE